MSTNDPGTGSQGNIGKEAMGSKMPNTDLEIDKVRGDATRSEWPEDSFTLNLRAADEQTALAAGAKEPTEVELLVGGAKIPKGEARWYYERLKEIEQGEHVLRFLFLSCLSADERQRQGFPAERPNVLLKDDQNLLFWQHLVVNATDEGGGKQEGKKSGPTIPRNAKLTIRSAIAIDRRQGSVKFVVRKPWKPVKSS